MVLKFLNKILISGFSVQKVGREAITHTYRGKESAACCSGILYQMRDTTHRPRNLNFIQKSCSETILILKGKTFQFLIVRNRFMVFNVFEQIWITSSMCGIGTIYIKCKETFTHLTSSIYSSTSCTYYVARYMKKGSFTNYYTIWFWQNRQLISNHGLKTRQCRPRSYQNPKEYS